MNHKPALKSLVRPSPWCSYPYPELCPYNGRMEWLALAEPGCGSSH
jgi:hypothetical protein